MTLLQITRIPKDHAEYEPGIMFRVGRRIFWVSNQTEDEYGDWKTISFGVTLHRTADLAEEEMEKGQ